MARIFRHHVSPVKLTLAAVDIGLIAVCAFIAEWQRLSWLDIEISQSLTSIVAKLVIPVVTFPVLLGFGAYQSDAVGDVRVFAFRLVLASLVSILILAAVAYLLPVIPLWRSILVLSFVFIGVALLL